MSYMNRPHSVELTQSLKNHGMDIKRPSQLSDAFRLGWWAAEKEAKQQRAELLEAAKAALKEAEAWIEDQLGGTSSYQPAMEDLQLIRSAINRAEAVE